MSKPVFTPGPWTHQRSPSDTCDYEVCAEELLVAGEYGIEDEANARLIAAAPEQNAALIEARDALDACEDYFDKRQDADCRQDGFVPNEEMRLLVMIGRALTFVEAALAKAEGR
jgi:hypothetical protein